MLILLIHCKLLGIKREQPNPVQQLNMIFTRRQELPQQITASRNFNCGLFRKQAIGFISAKRSQRIENHHDVNRLLQQGALNGREIA
jgi:hypothetical protein